jgi:hypothetical protein
VTTVATVDRVARLAAYFPPRATQLGSINPQDLMALIAATSALGFVFWTNGIGTVLHDWNDAPSRTLDEVLDRFEATALALEVRALAAENPTIQEGQAELQKNAVKEPVVA